MVKKEVVVIEVLGRKAKLSLDRSKMCGCCSNMFCGVKNRYVITADIPDSLQLKENDKVEIGIDSRVSLLSGVMIFLLPSVLFLAGLYLFRGTGVIISFLTGIALVSVYFFGLKLILRGREESFMKCKIIGVV